MTSTPEPHPPHGSGVLLVIQAIMVVALGLLVFMILLALGVIHSG